MGGGGDGGDDGDDDDVAAGESLWCFTQGPLSLAAAAAAAAGGVCEHIYATPLFDLRNVCMA